MVRRIIRIDEDKCNGCGLCVTACHENAIGMVDGKAKLLREDYCDGLGDCLPQCPTGAITFEEREAAAYDEAAVKANQVRMKMMQGGGCPGARIQQMNREDEEKQEQSTTNSVAKISSKLQNWPVQIKLAPVNAPYFDGANLLIAADCCAYAYASFHSDYIKGKITLIGCPKLDAVDYSEKLTDIIVHNNIKSVTIMRMEVPCCGGIEMAAKQALKQSGKFIPWQVVTISVEGKIVE